MSERRNPLTGGYVFNGAPAYYALTATGDVGIGNPFLGGGGPRGVQFARNFQILSPFSQPLLLTVGAAISFI